VRGTVRSTTNAAKIDPLRKAYGELFQNLELVQADLLEPESLNRAINGSTYVMHVASPVAFEEPKDEQELIRPALEGTLNVLKACQAAKVKRVCVTSSISSIYAQDPKGAPDVFDESHWSDVNYKYINVYDKSKTLAERAAWDFVKTAAKTEGAHQFELSTVNPCVVLGPSLVKSDFACAQLMNLFMQNQLPGGIPYLRMAIADVRDVAMAHLKCIETDAAQGNRHIISNDGLWWTEIAAILR